MEQTENFAIDVSQKLGYQANRDFIDVILELLPVVIPLIAGCFQGGGESFGVAAHREANEASNRVLKRLRFRLIVRRELGGDDYRDLGGGRCCDALVNAAAEKEPEVLQAIHDECCCC